MTLVLSLIITLLAALLVLAVRTNLRMARHIATLEHSIEVGKNGTFLLKQCISLRDQRMVREGFEPPWLTAEEVEDIKVNGAYYADLLERSQS